MMKVARTTIRIHLRATKISNNRWLINTTQNNDIPLGAIVDTRMKNMIMKAYNIYNLIPSACIEYFCSNYERLISVVHGSSGYTGAYAPVDLEPDNWATNYTDYYTKVPPVEEGDAPTYTAVTGNDAPTFASGTYYRAQTAPEEWAKEPLIGITTEAVIQQASGDTTPKVYDIQYAKAGDAVRVIRAYVDENLYTALSAVATDWEANKALWYYCITNRIPKLISKLLGDDAE